MSLCHAIISSGTIAFNFKASLNNGGGYQCYNINRATSTGQYPSSVIQFSDNTGSYSHMLSDIVVKFSYPSGKTSAVYYGGSRYSVCSGWSSLSYWPTSFNTYADSSTTCNYMSSTNCLSLSAGFIGVWIMNTCGSCSCADYRTYTGQLQIIGFSTNSVINAAKITSPTCSFPLSN